jgi:pimeloyl-ACP methyl ester carboxylesterase
MSELPLNFRLHGEPPYTLVAVHGGPGAPGSVYSLAKELSKKQGVLEPFQRASDVWSSVEELRSQITECTGDKAVLFGHSWGAWLVYLFAYLYPELVKKVFLIGAGVFDLRYLAELEKRRVAKLTEIEAEEYFFIIEKLKEASNNNSSYLKRLGEFSGKVDNYSLLEGDEYKEKLVKIDGDQYQLIWNEAAKMREEGFFIKIAKDINVPVRIIHGANDTTPIEGVVEPIKKAIKDIKWYVVDKAGHEPWKEKYGKNIFYKIVDDELKLGYAD